MLQPVNMQRLGEKQLRWKELIERADRRVGGGGDLGHRCGIVALFEEDLCRGFEQDGNALMAALAFRETGLRLGA